MTLRFKFTILFVSVFILKSFAQTPLTLQDAVNQALNKNLEIEILQNNLDASSILNSTGFAGGLPLVTGNLVDNESLTSVNQKLSTGNTIQRNNAAANALSTNVTGSILLYNGGRVQATKKRLAEIQNQSSNLLNSQIQTIIGDVNIAYYDVVRQQNYIKTIDQSIDASNQQLTIVKARQSVGLANNADLFQAQIDLNALQQSKQAQELIVTQAKVELLRLTTAKPDSAISIIDTAIVVEDVAIETIKNSFEKNALLLAADNQIKITEFIVKETASLRYPTVRANAGYNFSRNQAAAGQLLLNQNYGPTLGVSVAIPIFNGGIFKKQLQVAKIDVANAQIQKNVLLRDYTASAESQYQAYLATKKQIESEKENYKLSAQLLSLVLQRFQLRQATIVEVKNAQQSFEQSGFRLVNLSYAAKVAEVGLKRLGNLLQP